MQLPATVAAMVAAQDRLVLGVSGATAFSLFLMAATTSSRVDALPAWLPIGLDAAGRTDLWATPTTLWRIPLAAAMLTLINLVAALWLGRNDRFAARFLLASSLLVHVLAWVALVRLLW